MIIVGLSLIMFGLLVAGSEVGGWWEGALLLIAVLGVGMVIVWVVLVAELPDTRGGSVLWLMVGSGVVLVGTLVVDVPLLVVRSFWRGVRGLWLPLLIVGGLVVVGAVLWAAVSEPSWLLPDTRDLGAAERVKAQTDFRSTAVGLLGGLAVLVGGAVAVANLVLTQRAQWRAQVTDRFGKAIEQFGQQGPDKLDVRIGAVYALEQIARDSADLHWPIMEMLTAHLRQHSPIKAAQAEQTQPPPTTSSEPAPDSASDDVTSSVAAATERHTRRKPFPADLQAIATVIGRRRRREEERGVQFLDLREADLSGVSWYKAHLEGAYLRGAHLEGADLRRAYLRRAGLEEAHLERADLERADLRFAELERAHLEGAHLRGAHLGLARLTGADLRKTNLTRWQLLSAGNRDGAKLA